MNDPRLAWRRVEWSSAWLNSTIKTRISLRGTAIPGCALLHKRSIARSDTFIPPARAILTLPIMPRPEAFSRVLIDQALKDSGWDLLDERRVRFELDGNSGRADYVLTGERGPLCVLEAKRPDLDPYEAKEQARGYAENLRAPFVILSNGKEHW